MTCVFLHLLLIGCNLETHFIRYSIMYACNIQKLRVYFCWKTYHLRTWSLVLPNTSISIILWSLYTTRICSQMIFSMFLWEILALTQWFCALSVNQEIVICQIRQWLICLDSLVPNWWIIVSAFKLKNNFF